MMYLIVNIIQCMSIAFLFVECWIVFKNWKGPIHSCLFFACIATLINNIGYFMQLRARSEEAYLTALQLSYAGRVWIPFALVLFIAELVRFKIPQSVKVGVGIFNVITYIIVLTTKYTGLYYDIIGFSMAGQFPVLLRENGFWHDLWDKVLIFHVLFGMSALIIRRLKEENKGIRDSLFLVICAMMAESLAVIIQIFKFFPVTHVYDVTMIGFYIGTVMMCIAIFNYNLLNTETLAREYVIDELSEAIIAVNTAGSVSYYNKPAEILFPGLLVEDNSAVKLLERSIEEEKPLHINDRIYTADANPLYQNNAPSGTLFVITDDTRHYQYMEELEKQKNLADDANRAKSAFLANMSHEIRTPINAVLGMDEMILRESDSKEIRSYATDIQRAGRTLLSLVNDILDFSKIEEGRMEIIPTQYDLSSCINDIVNMIRERAEKKGLKFTVSLDENTPHLLYGDEIRIKQVTLNLLTNAVKYTETGEVGLIVGFRKSSDKEIILSFKISDTGIGMKEEDMDRLFSPFSRIEEKRNRTIEGTGLGMSIVKELLSLMDSSIDVKSVYGEGSEFSFDIKQGVVKWDPVGDYAARIEKPLSERKAYHELFHAPDARVLVVDDTEVNLTVIKNLLKKTEMQIDTVISGKEAVSSAKNRHYDIVFIDHMMPEMDGIETLNKLKELPDDPNTEKGEKDTVYIALTANAISGARQMYIQKGFSDYLSKPVDGGRLERMIRKYLPGEKLIIKKKEEKTGADAAVNPENKRILVVDDDAVICTAAKEILGGSFEVISCMEGEEAVKMAEEMRPELILLDINLGGMNGFSVLQGLKDNALTRDIAVMFITADEDREKEALGLKNGALDFIRKPFTPEVLLQRSKRIISLERLQNNLKGEVLKLTGRTERLTREMMMALSHTVDAKDHYTNGHSERVAAYSAEIGRRMGKSPEDQKKLYEIGLLHDIGKIGIPEDIITKKEALTKDEFGEIKEHTIIGADILKGIKDMPELSYGARWHHERYDGSGYPDGISGNDIPEVARIVSVADCYDAMTSKRTYSEPKPQAEVRSEIECCRGKHFDPEIADIMLAMIDDDKDYIMNEKGGASVWKSKKLIWDVEESELKENEAPKEEEGPPSWLSGISELDVSQGVVNCGSVDSYLSVLTVFYQTAVQKADEIERMYSEGDYEGYTVKVHALKSSARIIGAEALSEMAKELEAAGKADDRETIGNNTDRLLSDYRALAVKLKPLEGDKEELKELSDKMRLEAFQTMEEIAGSMDYGMMEGLLHELKGYALSPEDESKVGRIETLLTELDWDGIIEVIKGGRDE